MASEEEENRLAKELTKELKAQAKLQQQLSESLDAYVAGVKKHKEIQAEINRNKQKELQLEKELEQARDKGDADTITQKNIALKVLRQQTAEMEKQSKIQGNALAGVNKKTLIANKLMVGAANQLGSAAKSLGKAILNLPKVIESSYGKIKGSGLFDMDKSIRQSALEMGLLSKGYIGYNETIREASMVTNELGFGVSELAKAQAMYSENLGRSVMLGKAGLNAISEMAAGTVLGAEGAAKMAAEFEIQGINAERTRDYVEQTMNDASKMGLNASKVIKNIQNNMKMLNKYHFKDGVKGLAKMAQIASKLGVDMEFASSFADKMWDVEGAVDMSAQLQVMGGEWAKMADPFHLMYMARNDMAGLTEEIANAAASSAKFNAKTGEFELGTLEMHRLKIIAEQTGISYDELATAGKNAAKFTKIKGQVGFTMSKDAEEFLTNTAMLDEHGKAYIEVKGDKKYLNQLGASGKDLIEQQVKEKQSLAKRAKAAQSFDEKITNLINMFKTTMLPIVDGITEVLSPLIEEIFKDNNFKDELKDLGRQIGLFIKDIAGVIKTVGKFLKDSVGPKGIFKGILTILGTFKGLIAGAGMGASVGGTIGSAFGPLGSIIGTIGGGLIGGVGGGILGGVGGNTIGGAITSYDTGGSAHDGEFAGSSGFGNDPMSRGVLQNGKFHPIDKKDDLLAMKQGGVIEKTFNTIYNENDKKNKINSQGSIPTFENRQKLLAKKEIEGNANVNNISSSMNHSFEPISINGEIIVKTPGNDAVSIDLLKDASFRRDITRMIQSEVERNRNGGKNRG